jgi:NADH dehydrogenase
MILLVGATGILGNKFARRLLEEGHPVRILLRPSETTTGLPAQAKALVAMGAQPAFGDLKDRSSLEIAVQGIETVLTTANAAVSSGESGENNVDTVDRRGNRDLIDAAKSAGVKLFIFTSVFNANLHSPIPFFQAKAETEVYLSESGMAYTLLAPTVFMEDWIESVILFPLRRGQPVTLIENLDRKKNFVSVNDVAAFGIAALGHPAARNRRIDIGGPEALAWRDVIDIVERSLRQEIPVRYVPQDSAGEGISPVAHLMILEKFQDAVEMSETARTFGVTLTPVEKVLRRLFAG